MEALNTDVALVLEGGGYRGVFTAGVLDVLMERGVTGFGSLWGTSAGALNAASFRSRQIGRSIRIMLAFRDDRRLMSYHSLVITGNITAPDFLYRTIQEELDPCDNATFNASDQRLFACASDMVFGAPHYFEIRSLPEDVDKIRASCSLPLISTEVDINGYRYLDGGTTDSVPFAPALGHTRPAEVRDFTPAKRAVVVLTQHREYQKGEQLERLARASHRYADYPLYLEALSTRVERYMEQRERIWELEREGTMVVLAPPRPVTVATNEHDGAPLLDLYLQGRTEAERHLDEIAAFVG